MHKYYSVKRWIGWGLFFVLLAGCSLTGPKPDIVSEEKPSDEAYSKAEIRRMVVDQPHLMSGDYFRNRIAENRHPAGADGKQNPSQNRQAADPPANAGKERGAGHLAAAADYPYELKVGLILERSGFSGADAECLMQAADRAINESMILINDTGMREAAASADCAPETDFACLAENVALYPGIRMLVIINTVRIPEAFPGKAGLRFKLMDAPIGYLYPEIEITDRIADKAQADEFLENAMTRVFNYARRRAKVMPRHCRVFSVKNSRIYISAGEISGLKAGDAFRVVSGGELVKSPAGVPVAWVPGDQKGRIRVERLVREDSAGCRLIEGEMPGQGAYVLLGDF